jgi:hypothetical protein
MGSQSFEVLDLIGLKIPIQLIKGNNRLVDIYKPSSDLSSRIVISQKVKDLFEGFRKNSFNYHSCPIKQGKKDIPGYWITDKVIFDDQWIDFEKSIFEFIEYYLVGEVSKTNTFQERSTRINFANPQALWDFKLKRSNHRGKVFSKKIVIKDDCPLPILNFKTVGLFYVIISEEVKDKLEFFNFDKGIEFKPLEIPDEEWGGPNGLRKQFYK